jgi:DNA-binding transcriptional LysR family regulator
MLDVDRLVVLRAVAAHGSMAGAARQLGYTRSAISQQMSALERSAGATLLIRTNNRMSLTPIAWRLVEHTERILIELRAATATLDQDSDELTGALKVGIPFGEGPAIMGPALTGVRQKYPQLDITLATASERTVSADVRHGRLDVAIVSQFGAKPAAEVVGEHRWVLGHDALRLCVPVNHPLAHEVECSVADLVDAAWVMNPDSALGRVITGLCAASGFEPIIAGTVDGIATALGLVSLGWGVTIAPQLTPITAEATIRRIGLAGVELFRHTVLIVREGEQHVPAIAVVVDAVKAASATIDYLT